MKKFYLATLLACLCFAGFSQTTYNYTGSVQTYTVPSGVTSLAVDMAGGKGGDYIGYGSGGYGGRVVCTLAVTPGQVLNIYVGQSGQYSFGGGGIPTGGDNSGGGANGGAGSYSYGGAAGGAASDIRTLAGATFTELSSRIIVAAGGGGGAYDCGADNGGAGGGLDGGTGLDCGSYNSFNEGGPGSQTSGGAAGYFGGIPGDFGFGGDAEPSYYGGGGGGGWYGGGGAYAGGGCGGSSYIGGTGVTGASTTSGFQNGDGYVTLLPLLPCSGSISAGSTMAAPSMAGLSTMVTLSLSGATTGTGLTYQWQSSPTGAAPWTDITGATDGTYSFTGISTSTYYQCVVTCTASSSTSTSIPSLVTYALIPSCLPTSSSWSGESWFELYYGADAFSVTGYGTSTLFDFSITSYADPSSGYLDHTTLTDTLTLQQGGTYASSISWGISSSEQFAQVWIDFNDNGIFETSEEVSPVSGYSSSSTPQPTNFNITVPISATTGTHLMRMRAVWESFFTDLGYAPSDCDPCAMSFGGSNPQYYSGDVVDYLVNIVTLPLCTGTPDAGFANTSATLVCPSGIFTLNSSVTLASDLTYQWQSSSDSLSWVDISGATSLSFTSTETATTFYHCVVTCPSSGLSSASGGVKVTFFPVCYCVPTYLNGSPATFDAMSNFSLTGYAGSNINDDGPSSIPSSGYEDQTSISITLQQTGVYPGSLTYNTYWHEYDAQVWIDYDDNGSFDISEEVTPVFGLTGCGPTGTYATYTLTVPTYATLGTHRMRVRQAETYDCTAETDMDPCNTFSMYSGDTYYYGCTRDYSVTIIPPSPSVVAVPDSLPFGAVTVSTTSPTETFTLTGNYLLPTSSSISLTAPAPFQISLDGSTWFTTLSIPYTTGTIPATTIYVNFSPSALTTYGGAIDISGGSVSPDVFVPLSGIGAPACTGIPVAGTSAVSPTSGATTTPFTLSLTGTTVAGGLTFQWQSSSSSTGPWSDIAGATSAFYSFTGISSDTYFQCIVTCPSFTAATSTSTMATFIPVPSCFPTSLSWQSEAGEIIYGADAFTITGFSGSSLSDAGITSAADGSTGYLDRTTSLPIVNLEQSGIYPASVTWGSASPHQYVQVWIDFNNNGTFETSEEVTPPSGWDPFTTPNPTLFNITIPSTANPGNHLMRMRSIWEYNMTDIGSAPTHCDPCQIEFGGSNPMYYSGDIVDYMVNIVPLPPCSGTPTAGNATTSNTSVCPSGTFTLNITGTPASGLTYQWQSSTDSLSWTDISGATTIPYTTTETSTNFYRCVVTCTASGLTDFSSGVNVGYLSVCYCIPSYINNPAASFDALSNFSLTGYSGTSINDDGPSSIPASGYEDQTSISISLQQGGTYPGTITYNTYWHEYEDQVWIDFNDNGVFEISEEVTPDFGVLGCGPTGNSASFTLNIPLSATPGTHRMRVRQAETYNCTTEPDMDPCNATSVYSGETYSYGCTRDYTANIILLPVCTGTPTAGSVSATVTTGCSAYGSTLTVSGTTSAAGLIYQWQSSTDGSIWTDITGATTFTYSASVSSTTYYRFTSTCTASGLTDYSAPITLAITPAPGPISISTGGTPGGPFALCFTATGVNFSGAATGGTWSNTPPDYGTVDASTGLWTPTGITGTTLISYTIGSCTATASLLINSIAPATPTLMSGSNPVCAYSMVSLSDVTPGGVWSSSSTSIATVDASGNVTGNGNGTATISYDDGCGVATYPLTVNGSAIALTPTSGTVCNGATLNLTATLLSDIGTTYSWSGPGGSSTTTALAISNATTLAAGTYTFSTTTSPATGSCTEAVTIAVLVLPAPSVSVSPSNATICLGSSSTPLVTTTLTPATATLVAQNFDAGLTGQVGGTWTIINAGDATPYNWAIVAPFDWTDVTVYGDGSNFIGTNADLAGSGVNINTVLESPNFSTIGYSAATINFNQYIYSSSIYDVTAEIDYSTNGGSTWNLLANYFNMTDGTTSWSSGTPTHSLALPIDAIGQPSVMVRFNYQSIYGFYWAVDNVEVDGTPIFSNAWSGVGAATGLSCTSCSTPTITPTSAGVNVYSTTVSTGACSTSVYDTITVNIPPAIIGGTTSFCIGATSTLTNSVSGGTWSSGNLIVATVDATTGAVTGSSAGTADITYSTGCGSPATTTVTINGTPASISGTFSTCIGTPSTLTDATAGGTWSSSTPTIANVGTSNGIVIGTNAGTTTITYTTTCGFTTQTYTVIGNPPAISGLNSLCVGGTITLSDLTLGGTWSSNSVGIATIDPLAGIVAGVAAGIDTINYTTTCGLASMAITINAAPSPITGASSVCVGNTITLGDVTPSGSWTSGSTLVATIDGITGILNAAAPGTTEITYSNGCGLPATFTVTVNGTPALITGTTTICATGSTALTDATCCGTWSSSDISLATVNSLSGLVTGVSSGSVTITYSNGCGIPATTLVTLIGNPPAITGAPSVCLGGNITLSDATLGGTWTSDATGIATIDLSTGVISGIAVGTTTISYQTTCGYTTTSISVIDAPSAISGTGVVCAGSTTSLVDATIGGAWSMTSGAASVNSAGIVTGIAAGNAIATYSNGCGIPATFIVTVNPLPAPISGLSSICLFTSTVLTDDSTLGTWASSNPLIASIDATTGFLTGTAAGTATVSYQLTSTGCAITFAETILPLTTVGATISGPDTICLGATVLYTDPTTGPVTSTIWTSADTTIATVNNTGHVTGIAGGSTSITFTANGCSSASAIKSIFVKTPPSPGTLTVSNTLCVGTSAILSSTVTGGVWNIGGATSVSLSYDTLTGISIGNVTVTYSVTNSCGTDTATAIASILGIPSIITGGDSVCAMAHDSLFNSTFGGTWTSSSTTTASVDASTGVVYGVAAGTVTISYSTSCGTPATMMVTVNALPDAGTITGDSMVCAGAAFSVASTTTGGTWVMSNPSATIDAALGTGLGLSAGLDTIAYTVMTTHCGFSIAQKTITINPLPSSGTLSGMDSMCVGTSVTIVPTSSGGTWTISNTNAIDTDGIVTGASVGLDTLTYTISSMYCGNASVQKFLTVVPSTTVNPITGATSVCTGNIITLADASTGGTWSSSAPTVASVSGNLVSGNAVGIDTIKYTVTGFCGSAIAAYTITVNTTPNAGTITGQDSICIGATASLSDAVPGGAWGIINSYATINATGVVTGVASGLDTATYTVTNVCGSQTKIKTVFVKPAPYVSIISGNNVVCLGSNVTYTDSTIGGNWSVYNSADSISNAGIYTSSVYGADTIQYTYTNSCGTKSTTFAIATDTVLIPSVNGRSFVCVGKLDTLNGLPSGGIWTSSDTINTLINGLLTGVDSGKVDTIFYTVTNACGPQTAMQTVLLAKKHECDSLNGVRTVTNLDGIIKVYPNPSAGSFTVELPETGINSTIIVTDVYGKIIESKEVIGSPSNTVQFSLHNLANGTYMIKVVQGENIFRGKVLIIE